MQLIPCLDVLRYMPDFESAASWRDWSGFTLLRSVGMLNYQKLRGQSYPQNLRNLPKRV
jgi:hypothetical protein